MLIFSSCSQNENTFYPTNIDDVTQEIKGAKFTYDTLKSPFKLFIAGDHLFVTQDGKVNFDEPMIHVFDKETMARVASIGQNGMGPNEMLFASLLDFDQSDSSVVVFDSRSKRFSKFDIQFAPQSNLLAQEQNVLPSDMFDSYKTYKASDSTYLGVSTQKEYIFNEYDLDGEWITGYVTWPQVANEKQLAGYSGIERNYLLGEINRGSFKKEVAGNWYALAMNYRDRIELFNYKTKEVRTIEGPELIDEIQPFRIAGAGSNLGGAYDFFEAVATYRDVTFKPKYLYALYAGTSQNEYKETGILAETIFVFGYDMKLKGKLLLDKSASALDVDEELGKIYTITTDENPGIAVYDIPSFLF